jgi:hypothetical protein
VIRIAEERLRQVTDRNATEESGDDIVPGALWFMED